ncbi:hypothetical protein [Salidesulfovibrio brasiliensis]|uniref:hypothetical protein n=1 Tax=Salidesulfovibrio brasiliensis TaxID=221711 RepID=UPI0006D121B6|nr:hypothetical protein [Salidesulfovibrio brasiliensis]
MSRGKENWDDLESLKVKAGGWKLEEPEYVKLRREIVSLSGKKAECIIDIGIRLNKMKKLVSHGEFQATIDEFFPFSYSTANDYGNVARNIKSAEIAALFEAKALYALARPNFPAELREEIIDKALGGEKFTYQEIVFKRQCAQDSPEPKEVSDESWEPNLDQSYEDDGLSYQLGIQDIWQSLTTIVGEVKDLDWPEEPTKEDYDWIDSIFRLLRKLSREFGPVPSKVRRSDFQEAE